MAFNFLLPVADSTVAQLQILHHQALGHSVRIHTAQQGLPDLSEVHIALIGIRENRRDKNHLVEEVSFEEIRSKFYSLFPGNWGLTLADLGDIDKGASVEDTYFAVTQLTQTLVKQKIIPIFLGGSQDLTYPVYRAFDDLNKMVNMVNIDPRFDIGDSNEVMDHQSYVSKIIVDKPYNLFNYSNVGFQTYFNPQEEIDLMDKLHFEAFRLGNIKKDISSIEPVMRDADIVTLDLESVKSDVLPTVHSHMPNGFDGQEICAIARYAGISDRVSVFGVFEYKDVVQQDAAAMLIAQLLWYFIEGVNYRANEDLDIEKENFLSYQVPVLNEVLHFYKSSKTDRWWIEIPFISGLNNKLKRRTLLPCTYNDYLDACNQNIPERWYKARRKNEV